MVPFFSRFKIGSIQLMRWPYLACVRSFWRLFSTFYGGLFGVFIIPMYLVDLSLKRVFCLIMWFLKAMFSVVIGIRKLELTRLLDYRFLFCLYLPCKCFSI